jgi:ubiquitin thioesterase OTU1
MSMQDYQHNNDLHPIRREVDADNSCLFSSIAYLLDRPNFNELSALKFRQHIIDYLNDDIFDANLLDEPKDKYIEFIQNPKNWGGALEIKMFSDIFKKQIVCIDVKTNRADIYGEDKNFDTCIYLLYNGIHYDPLVMNFDVQSNSLSDVTIFSSNDIETFELMKCLLLEYKYQGDFVEFDSLECMTCCDKFKNENDALDHSLNYTHWDFKQI